MKNHKAMMFAVLLTQSFVCAGNAAFAAGQWQEQTFPAPNGGRLVFTITGDGNPACASYDAVNCLWGQKLSDIDLARVRPLTCGAAHLKTYGVTGFEDPKHWCSLALRAGSVAKGSANTPATQPPSPSPSPQQGGYRMTDWSGWGRAAGVEYRYRVGWDPANGGPGKLVDAMYEVRNAGSRHWKGAARSLNCEQNTLWGSSDADIAPGQTKEVRVKAPNCGNANNPSVRPNVIRAGIIDH